MKSLAALVALLVVKIAAAVAILFLSSTAFAQPGDTEPIPDEPTPIPPPVVEEPAPAPPPPPPPPPPPAPVAAPLPPVAPAAPQLGGTGEFGMGYGQWRAESDSISGWAGPSFGFGRFLTPQVALTLRVAGVAITDDAFGWIGVVGPHVQLWLGDQAWVGFGAGAAFGFACGGGGCFHDMTSGVDMRVGFSGKPRGQSSVNFSIEMTTFHEIKTLSLLLGYQSF